jgi:hypothetical protein
LSDGLGGIGVGNDAVDDTSWACEYSEPVISSFLVDKQSEPQ